MEMGLFIKTADKSRNPQKGFFGALGQDYSARLLPVFFLQVFVNLKL